jgi:hypothetical protein
MQPLKKASHLTALVLITIITIVFSACHVNTSYSNRAADKEDAEKIARRFYDLQKSGDFENLPVLYSKELNAEHGGIDPERLRAIRERLGDVREITLEDWKTEVRVGTNPSARYDLLYQVVRSKRMARESFSLVRNGDSIRIDNYEIEADGRRYVNGAESDSLEAR